MWLLDGEPSPPNESIVRDDLLRLVFTCCHPSLSTEAQVALSLRTLGGLSTPEVARAMLVSEATMAKRSKVSGIFAHPSQGAGSRPPEVGKLCDRTRPQFPKRPLGGVWGTGVLP